MVKKIISICLVIAITSFSTITVMAESVTDVNIEDATVTFIDSDGNAQVSEKSVDFFLELAEDIPTQGGISPYMIPTVDDNPVRISDVVSKKYTQADVQAEAQAVVGTIFAVVWARYDGKLIDLVTNSAISQNTWGNSIAQVAANALVDSVLSNIKTNPLSTKNYQYKT